MKTNMFSDAKLPRALWRTYVCFVIYGSLVPLKFNALSIADAWAAFVQIRFLELGVASRADWVANGVLYVPVGFLTAYVLGQRFQRLSKLLILVTAGAFSVVLAVGVEFAQLFFPPRTVSLNDLVAEGVGVVAGLILAATGTNWFSKLLASFTARSSHLRRRALEAYAMGYLAFMLFPYDLLLSGAEIAAKLESHRWGWLVAASSQWYQIAPQLLLEVFLTVPFGWVLVRLAGRQSVGYITAILFGLMFGALIELAQFFVASGTSQGVSVVSRAVGVCAGLALVRHAELWSLGRLVLLLRRYVVPVSTIYLVTLLMVNGWFEGRWQDLSYASMQLRVLSFVPFYYHYYTSEAKALFSLVAVSLSYVPAALILSATGRPPAMVLCLTAILASTVEGGKLFLLGARPDPTNVLLSLAVAWIVSTLVCMWAQPDARPAAQQGVATIGCSRHSPVHIGDSRNRWPLALLSVIAVWVFNFPTLHALVVVVLSISAMAVWRWPISAFAIIPAALPVFDLAPWSGRFFVDEFDALVAVCLIVAWVRTRKPGHGGIRSSGLIVAAGLLVVISFAVSSLRGLMPFRLPDSNDFVSYYSGYNALRIAKGVFWAALLYRLSRRFVIAGSGSARMFCWGMTVGLALTVAVVIWERVAFPGLWNFYDDYRATGPFSAIHTGGAYIEGLLACATPFAIMLLLERRHWLIRAGLAILLLATTYALMVTFSRNGYLAFAIAIVITLLAALLKSQRPVRNGFLSLALAGAMLLVAAPIITGDFAQARLATIAADVEGRQAHWREALEIRDHDWLTSLIGMGIGRYPETNYWRSTLLSRPATYQLAREGGNFFLRLGSGASLYVEQMVPVVPGEKYVLTLNVRATVPNAIISVPICEKWMLTSYQCMWRSIKLGPETGVWRQVQTEFFGDKLLVSPWYSQRPTKLSLINPTPRSTIDIDNVHLHNQRDENLLRNGDFAQQLDHWFFTVDGHLQWHVKSLYVGVLFDQGWLGLLSMGVFIILVLSRAARNIGAGDVLVIAPFAALIGFLVIGIFDTMIDAPRFLLLFMLLAWACVNSDARRLPEAGAPR